MSLKNIKESELRELLDEVASDLAKAFETEKDKLAKAEESSMEKSAVPASEGSAGPEHKHDDRQTQDVNKLTNGVKPMPMTEKGAKFGKDEVPGEKSPEGSASGSPAPESSQSSAAPGSDAPPDDGGGMPPEAGGAPAPEMGGDPAADQGAPMTPEMLQSEYSKLPPEELDMHIQAALAAKAALAAPAGGAPMGADQGAPVPPSPSPSPAPGGAPMAMNENFHNSPERDAPHGKGAPGMEMAKKHEQEISELKALVKSQQDEYEKVFAALKNYVESPQRKAVTSVAHLAKTESTPKVITKESVQARLLELSKRPDLKKSERQLINDFYDGRVKADALAPLFEGYTVKA